MCRSQSSHSPHLELALDHGLCPGEAATASQMPISFLSSFSTTVNVPPSPESCAHVLHLLDLQIDCRAHSRTPHDPAHHNMQVTQCTLPKTFTLLTDRSVQAHVVL